VKNRALIAGAVLGAALVSGGMLIQSGVWQEADAAPASPRLLEEVMARVRSHYIDTVTPEQMLKLAASGVVEEVDERYSVLLSPDRLSRLKENTSGRYAGIGAEVDMRDGFVTVIAPIAGTPADSAGLQSGDRILTIDGKSTYRLTMEEVHSALRGPAGSKVRLTIDRGTGGSSVTLTRRMIVYRAVRRAELLAGGIGYVKVATFNGDAAREVKSAVDSLSKVRGSSLILDLRENPGGLLEQGIAVADLFLDPGKTIVSTRGRTPETNRDFIDEAKQAWPGLPIVVLVDSGSASAAEIVAGALQDHKRAVLVGTATFGKGSAQSLFPVTGGYALKLTTARWFTPEGRTIERDSTGEKGAITPDVEVREEGGERREEGDTTNRRLAPLSSLQPPLSDAALQRAMQLLQGVTTPAALRARVPAKPGKSD
jgi:carboxyl-terminal processing protease